MFIEKIHAADLGTIMGDGPFGDLGRRIGLGIGEGGGDIALQSVTTIVSNIISIMTAVAGIWFLMNFIVGGIGWISAGGDKQKIEQSRDRITYAFIGLLVTVAGVTILAFAGAFLGYDITISDTLKLIQSFKLN